MTRVVATKARVRKPRALKVGPIEAYIVNGNIHVIDYRRDCSELEPFWAKKLGAWLVKASAWKGAK